MPVAKGVAVPTQSGAGRTPFADEVRAWAAEFVRQVKQRLSVSTDTKATGLSPPETLQHCACRAAAATVSDCARPAQLPRAACSAAAPWWFPLAGFLGGLLSRRGTHAEAPDCSEWRSSVYGIVDDACSAPTPTHRPRAHAAQCARSHV